MPTTVIDRSLYAPQTVFPDLTPTGYALVQEVSTGKFRGGASADKATIDHLLRDTDQVIFLGGGADIFVFQVNDDAGRINGVVDLGTGDDQVWLTHQLSDYQFTLRADGGIKVQYIGAGDADGDGAAITFRGAETFTFRNIDDVTGENWETITFTADQLIAVIQAGTYDHGLFA